MSNAELRARIRELRASGDLPSERPVIYGTGAAAVGGRSVSLACLICREPDATTSYFWPGGRVASLHAACDALWKDERGK